MVTRPNAGIKRNRLPAGIKAVTRKVNLDPRRETSLEKARIASGDLSLSLYLELVLHQIEVQNGGTLPIFSPELDLSEAHTKAA
ncbi:conserved protein of unknown function (plasmid) [Agreia sp. COWG]|nr:conserved protein of unknown function [Agreia sp. COWG]